jgi:predicted DNA-binding ribbon-helix-helix protein
MTPTLCARIIGVEEYFAAGDRAMKSSVIKRSVIVAGHKTSVSLEEPFWRELKEIAHARNTTLSGLISIIDSERELGNLSSAIRLFVLDHYRQRLTEHRPPSDKAA